MPLGSMARERPRPVLLLVDDHEDTRLMYTEFLQGAFEIHTVADAPAALQAVAARVPDVVVTDLLLPGMDGFELTRRLRSDPALRATPVICLSGVAAAAHEERARAAGCARFLQKPCMPDVLSEAITGVLDESSAGASRDE